MDLREVLQNTRVGELSVTARPTLSPSDTVARVAEAMRKSSHGSALVCENGHLVGIFTERDLLRVLAAGQGLEQPISAVMTRDPHSLEPDGRLIDALTAMDEGGYRRLPVIEGGREDEMIIDVKSVVHFFVEFFSKTIYNQAAHAQLIARHREGA